MRDYTVLVHCQHGDQVNTKRLFFLDVGRMPAASRESIPFNMVSYCSAIKCLRLLLDWMNESLLLISS